VTTDKPVTAPPIRERTAAIQKSIESGDRFPLAYFDSRRYVQHNLALGDGFGALLEFLDSLPAGSSRVRPIRTFEDGDISFAHLEYFLAPMGEVVGFEVHRWENGRIVEHWDNLQPLAGPGMTDGTVERGDPARTDDTKQVAAAFVRALVSKDTPEPVGEGYFEHHPATDPARPWWFAADDVEYLALHRTLGEGDFCLTMAEGRLAGEHTAFYDLFRVQDGLIAEHWDVLERIPPRDEWRNENGKF
jgi:predicted SnoaL-like aldol condensation-catalyzing enzyme